MSRACFPCCYPRTTNPTDGIGLKMNQKENRIIQNGYGTFMKGKKLHKVNLLKDYNYNALKNIDTEDCEDRCEYHNEPDI